MNKEKVLVLLSCFNGEMYLKEQLDSIINQKNVEVTLLIRDDGSSDGSCDIIKEYMRKYPNISFYQGKNVGIVESFNDLMSRKEVDNFKWISFCDQDDVWLPEKLQIAIGKLKALSQSDEIPLLYCSSLTMVDCELKHIGMIRADVKQYTKEMSFVQNISAGCTQVFNIVAVKYYRLGLGKRMEMHDYWMTLISIYFGELYYDKKSYILYRQHDNNAVGGKKISIKQGIKAVIDGKYGKRENMLRDFLNTYRSFLDNNDIKLLKCFCEHRSSLLKRLHFVFSGKYHGFNFRSTLFFKIRMLLGVVS